MAAVATHPNVLPVVRGVLGEDMLLSDHGHRCHWTRRARAADPS